jgi:hypothetical protein
VARGVPESRVPAVAAPSPAQRGRFRGWPW